jgi:hypothetical protein
MVGARFYDNGEGDEGAAFVYHGSAAGLSQTPNWMGESNEPSALYGPVSTAGDVNGDGYDDVIAGAYWGGQAYAYYGSPTGLSLTPDWIAQGYGGYFGIEVATVGDVNGDGYGDVMVGAFQYYNGVAGEGAAFLYEGSAAGLSPTTSLIAGGIPGTSRFGGSIDPAGDVNSDGYDDLIIGARLTSNGQTEEGKAFAYYGSANGPIAPTDVSLVALQGVPAGLPLPIALLLTAVSLVWLLRWFGRKKVSH